MLSRLIRHEWKETWRIPVISFIVILFLTLVCFICFRQMEPPADENSINAGAFVIMMLYCLIISCISTVVTIYIAIRFYRNLYTDEGYLMHTLPVTPRQLILAKLLVAALWVFVLSHAGALGDLLHPAVRPSGHGAGGYAGRNPRAHGIFPADFRHGACGVSPFLRCCFPWFPPSAACWSPTRQFRWGSSSRSIR